MALDSTLTRATVQPSIAALIVLRDLNAADGKIVLKAAIHELVAAGTWQLKKIRRPRRRIVVLARGDAPVPQRTLLALVSSHIEGSAAIMRRGEEVHELAAVMRHLRGTGHDPRRIVNVCMSDLAAAGLTTADATFVRIGGGWRPLAYQKRTDAGDAVLAVMAEELGIAHLERAVCARAGLWAPLAFAGSGISHAEIYNIFRLGMKEADNRDDFQEQVDSGFDSAFDAASGGFDGSGDFGGSGFDGGGGGGGFDGGGGGGGGGGD